MLSQTCEYALRAMAYIAEHGEEGPVLARDIAAKTSVPLKYLQKLLRDLVRAGILTSTRGIRGGFRLVHQPGKVSLAEVLAPFDDTLRQTTCPFGNPDCGIANPCPVHNRWVHVVEAYRGFLDTTTLQDLLGEAEKDKKPARRKKRTRKRG